MINAEPWLGAAVLLLFGVAAGAGMALLVRFLARRLGRDVERQRRLATLTFGIVVGAFAVFALVLLLEPGILEAALGAIAGRVVRTAPDFLIAVVIVVAGVLIGSALRGLLHRRIQPIRPGLADMAGELGYWTVITVAIIVAATQVGIAVDFPERILLLVLGGIVLAAAVGGGLGSRTFFAAVIAGRHVAKIVGVGDEIEVDGLRGTVLALGRASVRIGVDGAEAEVPNGRLLDGAVLVYQRGREATESVSDGAGVDDTASFRPGHDG